MSTSNIVVRPAPTRKAPAPLPATPTPVWKPVAIIAAVWLASFAAAEFAFRAAGDRVTQDGARMYVVFGDGKPSPNGASGFKLAPNAASDLNLMQGRSIVYTNSLGLRCGVAGRSWKPGPVDVLILGDSQCFGWGLDFESTMIGQLTGIAAREGRSVQNLGIGNHYLLNQFELLRWVYDQGVRPKRIAIVLTPYLIATAGGYVRQLVGTDGRLYNPRDPHKIGGLTSWLKMHFVTYPRMRAAVVAIVPPSWDEASDPVAIRVFREDLSPQFFQKTLNIVEQIRTWAYQRGIALSIAYTPMAGEYDFAPIEAATRNLNVAIQKDVPGRVASQVASRIDAPFIDVRPALAAESAAGHPLTLVGDGHYNEKTSGAAAKALYSGLFGASEMRKD